MKPLTNGGVSLISSKVVATFDDVKVSQLKTIESDSVVEDIKDEVSGTINLEKYSVYSTFNSSYVKEDRCK